MELCHSLILLGPGGKLIYNGPAFDLGAHFSSMGYEAPARGNVADFAMDVLAGFILDNAGTKRTVSEIVDLFSDTWASRSKGAHLISGSAEVIQAQQHVSRMRKLTEKTESVAIGAPLTPLMTLFKIFRVASSRQHKVQSCLF